MFGDYNLEDFSIFIKRKPYSKRSLLIIYTKMLIGLKFQDQHYQMIVENLLQNVDSTWFLRFYTIDMCCYK